MDVISVTRFRLMSEDAATKCLKAKDGQLRTYRAFDIMLGAYGFMFSQHARFLDEVKANMETRQWWMDRLNDLYIEITGEEC